MLFLRLIERQKYTPTTFFYLQTSTIVYIDALQRQRSSVFTSTILNSHTYILNDKLNMTKAHIFGFITF
jgi:hypothetical protein